MKCLGGGARPVATPHWTLYLPLLPVSISQLRQSLCGR